MIFGSETLREQYHYPETNDFGDFAKENIGKMESILRKYLPMQPMQPMPPLSAKYPMSTRTRGIQVCEIR